LLKIGVFHIPNTLNVGSMMMAENFMWYVWSSLGGQVAFVVPTPYREKTEERLRNALPEDMRITCVQERAQEAWRKVAQGTFWGNRLCELLPPELLECDVFVVLGGDDFTESYSPLWALMELYKFYLFKTRLKKRVFFLGQTVGPFSGWRHPLAIRLLKKLDLITCRDPLSYEYLKKNGLSNVVLCADLAFLPLAKEDNRKTSLEKSAYVVVPSRLLHRYMPYISYPEYVDFWCDLILSLAETEDREIFLLPHAMNSPLDDDRLMVQDIAIALKKKGMHPRNLKIISEILLPYEMRNTIFCRSLLTITARMHAAISTLVRGGVPLNIAYSEKSLGVIGKHFSVEKLVVDVRRFSRREELLRNVLASVGFALENYERLREAIFARLPIIQKLAMQNIASFVKLIEIDQTLS